MTVYSGEQYGVGFPEDSWTLDQVIEWLSDIRQQIPKQYRQKAVCCIDSSAGYEGSSNARIEITYERPETKEEMLQTMAAHKQAFDIEEQKLVRHLAAVRAQKAAL